MTVRFAASELESFSWTGLPLASTSAVNINTANARAGISLESSTTQTITADFVSESEIWIHFNRGNGDVDGNQDNYLLNIFNGTTVLFRLMYTNAIAALQYWDGGAFQTVSTGVTATDNTQSLIDIHIRMDNTDGILAWYVDNNIVGTPFTGDTIFTAATDLDSMTFRHPDQTGAFFDFIHISEVIVTTTHTIGAFLQTTSITGEGTTSSWGGPYTNIDENGIDDVDFINSSSANDVSTYTATNITIPTGYVCGGVAVASRTGIGTTGPQNMQMSVRSGTTNYFSSNVSGTDIGYKPFYNIFTTDPDTSALWTESGVNAMEIGVKAIT